MPFQNCDLIRCSSEQLAMESLGGSKISPSVAISNPNRPTALGAKRRRWFPFPTRYRGGGQVPVSCRRDRRCGRRMPCTDRTSGWSSAFPVASRHPRCRRPAGRIHRGRACRLSPWAGVPGGRHHRLGNRKLKLRSQPDAQQVPHLRCAQIIRNSGIIKRLKL